MNIQELLRRQSDLIELKERIENSLKAKTNSFQFGHNHFTQSELVEEVMRPMMEQHLINVQDELTKINDLVKSINCLIGGTMPEKVKV